MSTSNQGASPGPLVAKPEHQMYKLGHQMYIKAPVPEILILWSMAGGEHEDSACLQSLWKGWPSALRCMFN